MISLESWCRIKCFLTAEIINTHYEILRVLVIWIVLDNREFFLPWWFQIIPCVVIGQL